MTTIPSPVLGGTLLSQEAVAPTDVDMSSVPNSRDLRGVLEPISAAMSWSSVVPERTSAFSDREGTSPFSHIDCADT